MALSIGIVGLPNVGKSTLFNALVKKAAAQASNFPFTTIEPNVGIVDVPDERLQQLAAIATPERTVPATVTFVDIAGLVRGASQGEGLGNKFLSHIREVNAVVMVVRDFGDPNVTHVAGAVDPISDIETIETELALADLGTVEKRMQGMEGQVKAGNKEAVALRGLLHRLKEQLDTGRGVRSLAYTEAEQPLLQSLQLLTAKPIMYVLNVDESAVGRAGERVDALRSARGDLATATIVPISAKIEQEIAELSPTEQTEFLGELGLVEPGLNRLIREAYALLGLQTYFTVGPKEVRAWTIPRGATAPQAAGVIHTDFERGFIKADVIGFDDFLAHSGEAGARTAGKLRQEGKEYVVRDGDVIEFKFNV